jgi:hypothetical protein
LVYSLLNREFDFGSRPPSGQIGHLGPHWLERENFIIRFTAVKGESHQVKAGFAPHRHSTRALSSPAQRSVEAARERTSYSLLHSAVSDANLLAQKPFRPQ